MNVDMIVQNISDGRHDRHDLFLPGERGEARRKGDGPTLRPRARSISRGLVADTDVCKVSIVGIGMRSHAGVAAKMFQTLRRTRGSTSR